MVGALPFCVHRVWAGPVPVRLARFVGADSTIPVFTPAIAEGFEEPVLHAALELLFDHAGCDVVSLSPLSGQSPVAAAAERAAAGDAFMLLCSDSRGPHTVFSLPESFEEYLQSLSSSQRQIHRRYLRKLKAGTRSLSGRSAATRRSRTSTGSWTCTPPSGAQRGKLGHFGDWPASVDFNRDLISRMAATGRARFYELAGDGRVLAVEYCFVLGERCYWRLPARDTDPELEKLRVGRLSLAEMFRVLIEDGQRVVEGGPGHYDYKLRLGAQEYPLCRIVISGRSWSQRCRSAVLLLWADSLHWVIFRPWFHSLRARLGLSRPPLWRVWILTRI